MQETELLFAHKKPNPDKLSAFGFTCKNGKFIYRVLSPSTRLEITVTVTISGRVTAQVTDPKTQAPYVLHLTGAEGAFAATVRTEYGQLLREIADKCFERAVFKTAQAQKVLEYAREKYANEPEYLWKQFPSYAVLRRSDNAKWYAIVLQISPGKIGLPDGPLIEVLDLRANPQNIGQLINNQTCFAGYHMNKKHWITLCLNDKISISEILQRLDESFILARK